MPWICRHFYSRVMCRLNHAINYTIQRSFLANHLSEMPRKDLDFLSGNLLSKKQLAFGRSACPFSLQLNRSLVRQCKKIPKQFAAYKEWTTITKWIRSSFSWSAKLFSTFDCVLFFRICHLSVSSQFPKWLSRSRPTRMNGTQIALLGHPPNFCALIVRFIGILVSCFLFV